MKTILITGGAGFIGSHVVHEFVLKYPAYKIINLDALTYAGNLENLKDIEDLPNYHFIKADIVDAKQVLDIFEKHQPEGSNSSCCRITCRPFYYQSLRICND